MQDFDAVEVLVAKHFSDFGLMVEPRFSAIKVTVKLDGSWQLKLNSKSTNNAVWNGKRIRKKRSKKLERRELESKTQFCVWVTEFGNPFKLFFVQVEEIVKLLRTWIAAKAPIQRQMFVRQKIKAHYLNCNLTS